MSRKKNQSVQPAKLTYNLNGKNSPEAEAARTVFKLDESAASKSTVQQQLDWFMVHGKDNLFVEAPGNTTMMDIFTMYDDVALIFRADNGARLESQAGVYKKYLMDTNPAMFNKLVADAATIS